MECPVNDVNTYRVYAHSSVRATDKYRVFCQKSAQFRSKTLTGVESDTMDRQRVFSPRRGQVLCLGGLVSQRQERVGLCSMHDQRHGQVLSACQLDSQRHARISNVQRLGRVGRLFSKNHKQVWSIGE